MVKPSAALQGYSYIEVLVAVAVLAVCALPAADAIRSSLAAREAGANSARELRCLTSTMETVLTASYDDLWQAVKGPAAASTYSLAADPGPDGECGVRNVFISKYVHPYGTSTGQVLQADDLAEDTLLLVTVSGAGGSFPLTTLVDR